MPISLLAAAASDQSTDNTVAIVAIIATAVGALGAAILAAVAAGRRQKRELEHDLELRDVAEVRSLIDTSLRGATKTEEIFRNLLMGFATADEVRDRADEAMDDMFHTRDRLGVRLGREHEMTRAYTDMTDALTDLTQWMVSADALNADKDARNKARQPYLDAFREYVSVANRYVASRLPAIDLSKRKE